MDVYLEQHLSHFPNLCTRENASCPFWKYWVCLIKAFHNYFALEEEAFTLLGPFLHSMSQLHLIAAGLEAMVPAAAESGVT